MAIAIKRKRVAVSDLPSISQFCLYIGTVEIRNQVMNSNKKRQAALMEEARAASHPSQLVIASASLLIMFQYLLLILLFCPVITSFGNTVSSLPGFDGPLPFELETGYIGVDKSVVQLFYYFIKSTGDPKNDPILLWLTGGPGCSALSGLIFEIGPLQFVNVEYNGSVPSLALKPHSWTQAASIIFLDSPVGTGFSYAKNSEGFRTGDRQSCSQIYHFLRKWLIKHPEFLSNPLYVSGDSYSGKIVPLVALHISDGNKEGSKPVINLKGYVLGNAVTIPKVEGNAVIAFAHGMGLISDEIYNAAKESCAGEYIDVEPRNTRCSRALEAYQNSILGINSVHILEPVCGFASSKPSNQKPLYRRSLQFSPKLWFLNDPPNPPPAFGCRTYAYLLSYLWANDPSVHRALQIQPGSVQEWQRCNYGLSYDYDIQSSYDFHVNLSKRGYRSLIYSGDHDMVVTFVGTQAWIRSLNYSIIDDWRSWLVDGQIGGYTRTYSNRMTYATIKGGGHTAPEYQPKECFAMFKRWISNESL